MLQGVDVKTMIYISPQVCNEGLSHISKE